MSEKIGGGDFLTHTVRGAFDVITGRHIRRAHQVPDLPVVYTQGTSCSKLNMFNLSNQVVTVSETVPVTYTQGDHHSNLSVW